MARSIGERAGSQEEIMRIFGDKINSDLRVAAPGIIQNFDTQAQTVTVQIAIKEKIRNSDLTEQWISLPLLLDVPIVIPRAGGYSLTLPIKKGDECLVIFADSCIDAWFSHGGIQNQMERRRHDLSDAFAILGVWSQPKKLTNYSIDSMQLRSDNGTSSITLKNNEIDITAPTVKINGINFSTHTHNAPSGGGATSGPS